jgi:hypothetical protein
MLHEYMQISQDLRLLRLSKPAHMAVAAEPSPSVLMALSVAHAMQSCREQLERDIDGGDLRVDPLYVHPLFFPDERDSAREAHLESTSTRVDVSQHLAGALQALSPTVYRNWLYFDSDGFDMDVAPEDREADSLARSQEYEQRTALDLRDSTIASLLEMSPAKGPSMAARRRDTFAARRKANILGHCIYEGRVRTTIQDMYGAKGMELAYDKIMAVLPGQIAGPKVIGKRTTQKASAASPGASCTVKARRGSAARTRQCARKTTAAPA